MSPTTESSVGSRKGHQGSNVEIQNRGDGNRPSFNKPTSSRSTGILTSGSKQAVKRTGTLSTFVDLTIQSKHKMEFFHLEECCYTHDMYINAGKIYDTLKHETEEDMIIKRQRESSDGSIQNLGQLDFENEHEKRLTFELAFSALKYQSLFEDIIEDCHFFNLFPELRDEGGLVMVILYEYQQRKFQFRTPFPNEELSKMVSDVERAIMDSKTKLSAAIARHRIKASARSLEFLLPENVRTSDAVKDRMPAYFWVNQLKTSLEDVVGMLKDDGYRVVNDIKDLGGDRGDKVFKVDHHCQDLLVFPSQQVKYLQDNKMVDNGFLVRQDKSSCLAPHSVKYLLNEDDDVIHVNAGSGLTTAHIASLLKPSKSHIWAFGAVGKDSDAYRVHKNLERLGVGKYVKVAPEPFLEVQPDDSKFKSVRVVLVTADCTKSAVTNPVEFVVSEGEDMTILRDLSVGDKDAVRIGELMNQHNRILRHAMKFSKVQAVVYMTRSVHEAENENVVQKTVEYVNMIQQKKMPFRLIPPVLAFSADEIENNNGICGKYMKFTPSYTMNGCFVAVITREPEDLKDSAKDAIARAQSKGLLGKGKEGEVGEGDHPKRKKSRKKIRSVANPFKPVLSSRMQLYMKNNAGLRKIMKPVRSSISTEDNLNLSLPRTSSSPLNVPEHVRVVKHPAPFR